MFCVLGGNFPSFLRCGGLRSMPSKFIRDTILTSRSSLPASRSPLLPTTRPSRFTPHYSRLARLAHSLHTLPFRMAQTALTSPPSPLFPRRLLDADYFLSSDEGCLVCSDGNAWLGPLLALVVAGIVCGVFVQYEEQLQVWHSQNKGWFSSFGDKGVAFLITIQIIVMLKKNHERSIRETTHPV